MSFSWGHGESQVGSAQEKTYKITRQNRNSKLPRQNHLESLMKLEEDVMESGCRDNVPTTGVLKNIAYSERVKKIGCMRMK